ncbi:hypothetical protein [Pseudomonas sp. PSPC3-3]|uniref:hypothetical protein n=1 Tax=unclassified Pseudomonas TaxID=196821 RepID=UPI003CF0830F
MPQPYAFINDRQQTSVELKASLRLSPYAEAKFDTLNTHIRNVVVLPGQLVIIGDETTAIFTPQESHLMRAAWDIRHSVMAAGGDAFALHNYDLLKNLLSNSLRGRLGRLCVVYVAIALPRWNAKRGVVDLKQVEAFPSRLKFVLHGTAFIGLLGVGGTTIFHFRNQLSL